MVRVVSPTTQEVEKARAALKAKNVGLSWRFNEHPHLIVDFSDALTDKRVNAGDLNEVSSRLETLLAKGAAARSETEREAWKRKASRVLSKAEEMARKKPHKAARLLLEAFAHPQALHQAEMKIAGTSVRTARRLEKIGTALSGEKGIEYYPLRSWRHEKVKERHASIIASEGEALLRVENGASVVVTLPRDDAHFTLHHPGEGGGEVKPLFQNNEHRIVVNGVHLVSLPFGSVVHIADNAFRIKRASLMDRKVELVGEAGKAKGINFSFTRTSEVPIGRGVKNGIRLMGR